MNIPRLTILLLLSLAPSTWAQAHAFLDHASPRVGSSGPAPALVQVFLTEELESLYSQLQVFDRRGNEVDGKDAKVSGATITVSVPKLVPGLYEVRWKALSTDTHKTSGTFHFTVQ